MNEWINKIKIGNFPNPGQSWDWPVFCWRAISISLSLFFFKHIQMTLGLLDHLGPVSVKQNTSGNVKPCTLFNWLPFFASFNEYLSSAHRDRKLTCWVLRSNWSYLHLPFHKHLYSQHHCHNLYLIDFEVVSFSEPYTSLWTDKSWQNFCSGSRKHVSLITVHAAK